MFAMCALVAFIIFAFPDHLKGPNDLPPTTFENIVRHGTGILMWPIALTAEILGQDPPMPITLLLLAATGLFWASLLELIRTLRRKKLPASA
jgi:hypothetical protein